MAARSVLCLVLLFVSTASSLLTNGKESLLIQEAEKPSPDNSKLIIAHSPSYVTFLPNAGTIAADEISNVIALALGFSSTKELNWAGLLAGDLFRRPKANVLITVDGITKDDQFDLPGRVAAYPVQESEDASSLAAILSTSSVTQENLPTRVTGAFGGKSLTVSVSGSELLAAAGHATGANSHTLFWSQAEDKFKQVEGDLKGLPGLTTAKDEILKRLEKAYFGKGVKFSSDTKEFTVSIPGKGNAVFNMEKKEDFLLFAEIDAIFQIIEKLKSNPSLVQDGIPDIYTLSLSSLKILRRRYGDKSSQAEGAVHFLQGVIPTIVKEFTDLYNGNVLVEVLSLEWKGDLHTKYPQEMHVVYNEMQPYLSSQSADVFRDQLPAITLRHDVEDTMKESLCEALQNKLLSVQSPLRVTCARGHRSRRAAVSASEGVAANSSVDLSKVNLAPVYSADYPVIFNICLWLLVVLALALYVISLVMWYLDPGRDSIIYRMTSQRIKTD